MTRATKNATEDGKRYDSTMPAGRTYVMYMYERNVCRRSMNAMWYLGRGAVTDNSDEWDTRYVGGIL